MQKENKENRLHVRMAESDINALDDFINFWYFKGVTNMNKADVVRNALNEYIESYKYENVILEGNPLNVRMDPNKYKFSDLFDMASDMQKQFEKETDQSKKYLYGKMFELLSTAVNLEFNVKGFKQNYKIQNPEELSKHFYKITNRLVANFGEDK